MPLLSITRQLDSQGVVERLQREQRELTARSLAFFEIDFDEAIEQAVIELLRFYSRKGRRLGELDLFICPGNRHVDKVLEVALSLDLFSKIYLQGTRDPEFLQPSLDCFGLQMRHAQRLTKLQLSFLSFSREDAVALRSGLERSSSDSEASQLEQISLSNIHFMDGTLTHIFQGFQNNKSLQVVALLSCGLSDTNMADLVDSLASHPSLKTLRLFGNQCRSLGLHAIVRLLSSIECKLQCLDLHHQFIRRRRIETEEGGMRIEQLLEGWQRCRNKTLNRLVLSGNKLVDEDMDHLSMLLRRLPCLEELDLDSNQIRKDGLRIFAQHNVPSRLRILRLAQNQLTSEASSELVKVLKVHPELHTFAPSTSWKSTADEKEISHLLDVNHAGRVLLHQNNSIPLSVWPIVLARLNPQPYLRSGRRPANVNGMYHLLRYGPVLLQQPTVSIPDSTEDSSSGISRNSSQTNKKRKRDSP